MPDDMEQRLVALINNSTERLLDRFGGVESRLDRVEAQLRTVGARLDQIEIKLDVTRQLVFALPGTLAEAFEKAIVPRLIAIEERLAALEPKP